MERSPLAELPSELRNLIYVEVLSAPEVILIDFPTSIRKPPQWPYLPTPTLLRTCRQIHQEARDYFRPYKIRLHVHEREVPADTLPGGQNRPADGPSGLKRWARLFTDWYRSSQSDTRQHHHLIEIDLGTVLSFGRDSIRHSNIANVAGAIGCVSSIVYAVRFALEYDCTPTESRPLGTLVFPSENSTQAVSCVNDLIKTERHRLAQEKMAGRLSMDRYADMFSKLHSCGQGLRGLVGEIEGNISSAKMERERVDRKYVRWLHGWSNYGDDIIAMPETVERGRKKGEEVMQDPDEMMTQQDYPSDEDQEFWEGD